MEDGPLIVAIDVTDGTATVSVDGEVDIATVGDLGDGLARALAGWPSRLVVDLSWTTFIDCSGMGVIAQTCKDVPVGCKVILRSPNRLARRAIELIGLDGMCLIDR